MLTFGLKERNKQTNKQTNKNAYICKKKKLGKK